MEFTNYPSTKSLIYNIRGQKTKVSWLNLMYNLRHWKVFAFGAEGGCCQSKRGVDKKFWTFDGDGRESKFWSFCDKVIIGRLQSFQQVSLITQWFCINDTRSSFNVINNMENLLPYVIEWTLVQPNEII